MREAKIMPYNMDGAAEDLSGFLGSHTSEVSELNKFGKLRVLTRESLDSSIQFQNLDGFGVATCDLQGRGILYVKFQAPAFSALVR